MFADRGSALTHRLCEPRCWGTWHSECNEAYERKCPVSRTCGSGRVVFVSEGKRPEEVRRRTVGQDGKWCSRARRCIGRSRLRGHSRDGSRPAFRVFLRGQKREAEAERDAACSFQSRVLRCSPVSSVVRRRRIRDHPAAQRMHSQQTSGKRRGNYHVQDTATGLWPCDSFVSGLLRRRNQNRGAFASDGPVLRWRPRYAAWF